MQLICKNVVGASKAHPIQAQLTRSCSVKTRTMNVRATTVFDSSQEPSMSSKKSKVIPWLDFSFLPAFTSKSILTHFQKFNNTNGKQNITYVQNKERCFRKSISTLLVFSAGCLNFNHRPTLEEACRRLDSKQQLITFFAENYSPINCRSSLEGVFHFDYQVNITSKHVNNCSTIQNAYCTVSS